VISTPGTIDELMPPAHGGSWTEGPIVTEAHPAFGIIARNLPKVDGLLAHAAAVRAIAARIPDLLRLDLGVVLVGGWKKLAELRSYTDAEEVRSGGNRRGGDHPARHYVAAQTDPRRHRQFRESRHGCRSSSS
jgi:hypothetical protein